MKRTASATRAGPAQVKADNDQPMSGVLHRAEVLKDAPQSPLCGAVDALSSAVIGSQADI